MTDKKKICKVARCFFRVVQIHPYLQSKKIAMELKTIRTVLGAKVTTFDRRTKVHHKKKEAYKGSVIANNQIKADKQDLLNKLQAKNWQRSQINISEIIEAKKQAKRLKMKEAGKAWKLKNKSVK